MPRSKVSHAASDLSSRWRSPPRCRPPVRRTRLPELQAARQHQQDAEAERLYGLARRRHPPSGQGPRRGDGSQADRQRRHRCRRGWPGGSSARSPVPTANCRLSPASKGGSARFRADAGRLFRQCRLRARRRHQEADHSRQTARRSDRCWCWMPAACCSTPLPGRTAHSRRTICGSRSIPPTSAAMANGPGDCQRQAGDHRPAECRHLSHRLGIWRASTPSSAPTSRWRPAS